MRDLFRKLEQPALIDLEVRWPGGAAAELAGAPPADVYAGDPARDRRPGAGAAAGPADTVRQQRGTPVDAAGPDHRRQPLRRGSASCGRASASARSNSDGGAAQTRGQRQAIIELALAHHLVSNFTSLIAVDVTPVRPAGTPYARDAGAERRAARQLLGEARPASRAPRPLHRCWLFVGVFALALAGRAARPGPAMRGARRVAAVRAVRGAGVLAALVGARLPGAGGLDSP